LVGLPESAQQPVEHLPDAPVAGPDYNRRVVDPADLHGGQQIVFQGEPGL